MRTLFVLLLTACSNSANTVATSQDMQKTLAHTQQHDMATITMTDGPQVAPDDLTSQQQDADVIQMQDMAPGVCSPVPECPQTGPRDCCNHVSNCIDGYCWNGGGEYCNEIVQPGHPYVVLCWHTNLVLRSCNANHVCQ